MKIGRLEIIWHPSNSENPIDWGQDFIKDCGIWYYLPLKWSVTHYLREGRKLWAVKLCKYRTGLGLKESKDWVDKLQEKKKIVIR